MLQILITGASGFVGKNLSSFFLHYPNFKTYTIRLREENANEIQIQSSVIIHLAGKAHDLKNVSQPEEYYQVNFELTKKLYDTFLKSEAKKFIFISTVKAVADHLDEPLTEDHKPNH